MGKKIAIVGGGASCIAFIESFVNECSKETPEDLHLVIFEKLAEIGPGNAYQTDSKSNLLNTKAGYISAFKDRPGDFFRWLAENRDIWKKEYPDLEIHENSYAPRPLFGKYMQDAFISVVEKARQEDIKVEVINKEVIDVKEDYENDSVILKTSCNTDFHANKAVIACGTSSMNPTSLPRHDNIYHSPYPINALTDTISKDGEVAIIGARLSAIDAVIGLIESGHTGKITLYSRSGLFPSVRGVQGRYKNQYLAYDFILRNYPDINLNDLAELFYKEMERYRSLNPDNMEEELVFPPPSIDNFEDFLHKEIQASQHNRGWQAVLYDTNSMLADVWNMLPENEQDIFINTMLSHAMALRVSIPTENAIKMLEYVRSGQLDFVSGSFEVKTTETNGLQIHSAKGDIQNVDAAIYATGSPRNIKLSDSELLRNMVNDGLARPHPFGGIDVCKHYHSVVDNSGNYSNTIYAIGEITHGRFLFTSAMDIIVRHAHKCATTLHKHLLYGRAGDLVT